MPEERELSLITVAPVLTPEEAKRSIQKFADIQKAMLDEDDYQEFEHKGTKRRFPKKSAFRKLALAFNISDEIIEERYEAKGEDIGVWHFTVKAIAPNGRYATGIGSFSTDERDVAHIEHDPRAMAHTRAKNRAISDLIAGGMLSAEEVLGVPEYKPKPPTYGKPVESKKVEPPKEEDVLKRLRQQVSIEWDKTGKSTEERKAWQKSQYGVESLTELPEEKLKDMLSKIKDMVKPDATKTLGFSSLAEQLQMRKQLFDLIGKLGYGTDDEKRTYIVQKGWGKTSDLSKARLEECIEEVKREKEAVVEAESIPEEL